MEFNNLLDVDSLIALFLKEHEQGIITLHKTYFHNDDQLSIKALIVELIDELKTGCVCFLNKEDPQQDLGSYLFYIANAFCKKKSYFSVKKKTEYLCPGCLTLNKQNVIELNNVFNCNLCAEELKSLNDPKKIMFFKTFAVHNKHGYRCDDCDRFLPHPLDNSLNIICPYFDCCYVGSWSSLKRMNHPTTSSNPEKLILDSSKNDVSFKNNIVARNIDPIAKMEVEEDFNKKISILKDVIESQINSVIYSSSEFTIKHKICCYQAFSNLLERQPLEMMSYLLDNSRTGGFQQKIFQEYISLLEKSLPYSFKKNNKIYKVESLLDEQLSLFDGISVFNAIVSDKLEVKNNTKEFYIGGRKASYTKPFYIGKLLSIYNVSNNENLMNNVEEYGFSKIKLSDIVPGTEVIVTHLRVPPHYQMGGMVYVNRLRKKIIDRAILLLNNE